ncbi:tetratricopeptide repeat protein [uncultured Desulfosarcina sp.]|uniref:tetratricopeptide repeat protein n=1 Tax=uncultured Desulfosarcina sp. TaxID=218289 RepID=UPI0029C70A91|nr:tetratricopeptide repeat protein [uncultured Desulfosarcina sp.]
MSGIDTILNNSLNAINNSGLFEEKDATAIFDALSNQQEGMENLSNQFLQTGIDEYLNQDYEKAAKSFEAAVNLAPYSDYNIESSKYLVQTYLKLEETDKAIETYQAAIQRNPNEDTLRASLGQLFYSEERYEEATEQYRQAVQVNPSATNRYSYGEALIKVGNFSEAEYQFNQVKRLDPESYAGDYGLGKMYAQDEQYDKAIEHFQKALKLESTFYDALAEIGYTYADMGEIEAAREVEEDLEDLDEDLATTLKYYIDEKEPPQIAFAFANSSFPYSAPKGYLVSNIDSYLENAGAEVSVTMEFLFTKEMDPASIEDRFNWNISRASSDNIAETYNFGDEIPSTEISLDPYPDYVIYDKDSLTATVGFTIRQNETADGTIDPSHIVFKFDGEDVYGVAMDPDSDEFSGFSRTA